MSRNRRFFALVAAMLSGACATAAGSFSGDLLLSDVTVVDVAAASLRPGQDVLISGSRITQVLPHGSRSLGAQRVIEGRGAYVIPGLWDMHAHIRTYDPEDVLPMFVAEGITGIRDLGLTSFPLVSRSRAAITAGSMVGPRIISSGVIVEGPGPRFTTSVVVSSVDEIPKKLDTLVAQGIEVVKLFENLPPAVYRGLVAYASAKNLLTGGHIPNGWSQADAATIELGSIEHFWGLQKTLSFATGHPDSAELDRLAAALIEGNTFETPTLINDLVSLLDRAAADPRVENSLFKEDPARAFVPRYFLASWERGRATRMAALGRMDYDTARANRAFIFETVRELSERGVRFLAGTDTPNPYLPAGVSLHDELKLFVEAGLTPAEALRTATVNPAMYFGRVNDLGAIAPGFLADLVVLEGNPLVDIGSTRSIAAVVANGRLFSKEDLATIRARQSARLAPYAMTDLDQVIYMIVRNTGIAGARVRYPDPLHDPAILAKPSHLVRLSDTLFRSGERKEAIEALEWNAELFPDDVETSRRLEALTRDR